MERIYAERTLEIVLLPMDESLAFRGEEQDLQEMLGNLIDNACKWAASRIEVQVETLSGELSVSIDDDGHGIAGNKRDAVLKRGVRADELAWTLCMSIATTTSAWRIWRGCTVEN